MSDPSSNRPISIEAVASKLSAIRNFEHPKILAEMEANPRLIELLLFLQFISQPDNYPGGMDRFTRDLIADSRDLIGTRTMREIGERKLSASQAREIYESLPDRARVALGGSDEDFELAHLIGGPRDEVEDFKTAEERQRSLERRKEQKARVESLLRAAAWETFAKLCTDTAQDDLARYLRELCELAHVGFGCVRENVSFQFNGIRREAPWYFSEARAAVLRFMDRRAERLRAQIAETEITRIVFKWLGTARRTSRAVLISGNSRFGKTQALQTWCAMNPGVARLVNTPASSSESDLLREVAKAIGLESTPTAKASQLRDRIDYVLRNTRLMLVFDESHLFYPTNLSRNTAPARLSWVRRNVMDQGLPCAFCATPQSYNSAKRRFVKTTGHAIEQFDERLLKTVDLPTELAEADPLAVAKFHFPGISTPRLKTCCRRQPAPQGAVCGVL